MLAVGFAFITGSLLMIWANVDPLTGYIAFLSGSLGGYAQIADTLLRTTPFLLMAVGIAFSNRAGVLNVGAEGQYIMGAIATTAVALYLQNANIDYALALTISLIAGAFVGALWASVAGIMRAYFEVNEIVVTVIMNWLAFKIMQWLLRGPLKSPLSQMWPMSPPIDIKLPVIMPGTRLHGGFVLAIGVALLTYYVLFKTKLGYMVRVLGANPHAARYAGFPVKRLIAFSMAYSGALAGLAGGVEVLGVFHFLYEGIAVGLGYTSIIASLLGRNHPLGIIGSSLLFGMIYNGSVYLQSATGLTYTFSKAVEGLIYMFFVLFSVLMFYEIRLVARREKK
ncbi:ABC transporter permease [Infirmifilum sp.]|uniref:ABC transporter permease n=1 Tax=Infirmifilum sp. TaxID=2856575 RepID=UPI003D0B67CA